MTKIRLIVGLIVVMTFSQPIFSGDIATERTQAANTVVLNWIRTAEVAIQTASERIQEFENLSHQLLTWQNWPFVRDVLPLIDDAKNIVSEGQAIAYSMQNLEGEMMARYKDYEDYLTQLRALPGDIRSDYQTLYQEWSDKQEVSIRKILKGQGFHAAQFAGDEATLQTLREQARTAEGRNRILQVGQEIAAETINQITKLRQLVIEQSSLHASYFADKQAKDSYKKAAKQMMYEIRLPTINNDGIGFQ